MALLCHGLPDHLPPAFPLPYCRLTEGVYVIPSTVILSPTKTHMYRGADKSLARAGRKQATATEGFDVHISYL